MPMTAGRRQRRRPGPKALGLALAVVFACASAEVETTGSEPKSVMKYDPAKLPGRYTIDATFNIDEREVASPMTLDVREGAGGHFELFAFDIGVEAENAKQREMLMIPIEFFSLNPTGPHSAQRNPKGFLEPGGTLTESLFFMLPLLSRAPVGVGSTWTGTRTVPVGFTISTRPELRLHYELLAREACPAPQTGSCLSYSFTAETGRVRDEEQGVDYEWSFVGHGWFTNSGQFLESSAEVVGRYKTTEQHEATGTISVRRGPLP